MSFRPHRSAKLPSLHSKGLGWIAYKRGTVTLDNERATHRHAASVLHLGDTPPDKTTRRLDGCDVVIYHRPGVGVSTESTR